MNGNTIQTKDNHQLLLEILDELVNRNPNIISAIVVSDDGLKVGSGIPMHTDDNTALNASDLLDTVKDFSERFAQGRITRVLLEGEQRTTVILTAGKRTVLVVLVPANEKLGLITQAMRTAADEIAAIFG